MQRMKKGKFKKLYMNEKRAYDPNAPIVNTLKYPELMGACYQITLKDGSGGTGFAFSYKQRYFLVSAAHVVVNKNRVKKKHISIHFIDHEPVYYETPVYYHKDKYIDVCVMSFPKGLSIKHTLSYHYEPTVIGESYYILGYPGIINQIYPDVEGVPNVPYPIIKKGLLSYLSMTNDFTTLMIDTISLNGLSGGPIVGINQQNEMHVIGVLVGSNTDVERIIDDEGDTLNAFNFVQTSLTRAPHIMYAIDIIEQNGLCGK